MTTGEPSASPETRKRLKAWIEEGMGWKGWRTPQLAEKSGVSRGTISKLVNLKTDPTDATMKDLAKALGRPLPAFYAGAPPVPPDERMLAREVLNIFGDAVRRAKAIMAGDGDPGVPTPTPTAAPEDQPQIDAAFQVKRLGRGRKRRSEDG